MARGSLAKGGGQGTWTLYLLAPTTGPKPLSHRFTCDKEGIFETLVYMGLKLLSTGPWTSLLSNFYYLLFTVYHLLHLLFTVVNIYCSYYLLFTIFTICSVYYLQYILFAVLTIYSNLQLQIFTIKCIYCISHIYIIFINCCICRI